MNLICVLLALSSMGVASAQVLLEDFSTQRKNGMGTDLFAAYLGEDPQQTYTIENQMLKLVIGAPPNGVYWQFFPNTGSGYPYPAGFARNYIKSGTFDPNTNRLRMKMKCTGNVSRDPAGSDVLQIGTYIKSHTNPDESLQGAHYYHLIDANFYANQWSYIELNRVPQHQVGASGGVNWPEDPEKSQVHYFDGLTRFYFDTQGSWSNQTCYFDDLYFDTVAGEPETYVSSLSATYSGSAYEVSFAAPKNTSVSFRVRYSTASMKAAGFNSGIDGGTVSNPGNDYTGTFWKSPNMAQAPVLYVAIQPVGQTQFREIRIGDQTTAPTLLSSCDVNRDGAVNAADVQLEVDAALNVAACTTDLNADGRCDVVDVQRIVNASLGGTCRTGQ